MTHKAIIFDFFDVIRGDPFQGWLRTHGFKREGALHQASEDLDHGLLDMGGFAARLAQATGQSAKEVEAEFERHSTVNYEVVKLIEDLLPKYKIGLLSNAQSAYLRAILADHDLERLFHHVVISSEVGMIKPKPEIFHHILERLEAEPAQAIFVDDNAKNVAAAVAVGVHGIQFTDVSGLRRDLARAGISLS